MALDEPQDKDFTVTEQGVSFAIDKELLEKVKPVVVDFMDAPGSSGFRITSSLPEGEGCGGSCG
jgi:iron-sulfur cluster assembly protein